jgi:hypothetical protein
MLTPTIRILAAGLGLLMLLGGLIAAPFAGLAGIWSTILGAGILIALAVERNRYRSEAADRALDPYGPGGGEPAGTLDPRFRPTPEVFVDPTSRKRMRVYLDNRSGERRYVAED